MMTDDMELVRDYARSHSEEAFATLVSRHINLVYSVALRQARDAHLAEEVTQVVFVILARKAGALSPKTIISGWLCRTARNVSARALTMRQRRQNREQEAYMQSILNEPESESAAWTQIAPLLEAALGQLGGKDHDAVVLRFFEGKSFKEVGAAIGTSEDTAKKRVTRTLEKLRRFFLKRGVALSTAVIAGAVTANSVQAAPETLAKSVTAVALTKGAALGGSTLTLIKGALKIMAWTKMKTTVVIGVAVLLAAGTAPVIVQHISRYREKVRDDAVWSHITKMDSQQLRTAPPAVSIRPAQFGPKAGSGWLGVNKKQLGAAKSVAKILQNAYGIREARIIASTPLPSGQYDYIVTLPDHQEEALQAVVKEKFGLVGKKEMREADVLLLKIANSSAPGLQPSAASHSSANLRSGRGQVKLDNSEISSLAFFLEQYLKVPVIDQTGLPGRFDINLEWDDGDSKALKQTVLDQLGMELVATNQTIEMLVVEKVK